MTVAVVANGGLFFAKGYGLADRAAGRKVDPERTLFRVGSVSKLFTWTAVMQQVERGKLDLKADVNTYLAGSPVRVPDTYPRPVTMIDLMTHTPGFEDVVIGLFARSPASMRPLAELLAAEMPARVRPPAVLSSYSNHGTALAGYIVERVSGIPFEQYVEQEILAPLGMSHTAVRQPLPKAVAADMSVGYRWADGEHKAQGFEYRAGVARGSHQRERGGHDALHARAPAGRALRAGADPVGGDRARDAQPTVRPRGRPQRHAAWLLPDGPERPPHLRSWR